MILDAIRHLRAPYEHSPRCTTHSRRSHICGNDCSCQTRRDAPKGQARNDFLKILYATSTPHSSRRRLAARTFAAWAFCELGLGRSARRMKGRARWPDVGSRARAARRHNRRPRTALRSTWASRHRSSPMPWNWEKQWLANSAAQKRKPPLKMRSASRGGSKLSR